MACILLVSDVYCTALKRISYEQKNSGKFSLSTMPVYTILMRIDLWLRTSKNFGNAILHGLEQGLDTLADLLPNTAEPFL